MISYLSKVTSLRAPITAAALMAGVAALAPTQSGATPLQVQDLNGAGAQIGAILLDKLNTISSPQFFFSTVNVGADKTVSNGDTFSQTLNLVTNSSSLGILPTSFALGGDYRITANISGAITSVGGTPIVINADNSVSQGPDSLFSIAFTSATLLLENNVTGEDIANLVFVSGGGSNIQLVAGSFIGDTTINSLLGPGCISCDPYVTLQGGGTLVGQQVFTITTGSARFVGFDGTSFANNSLIVNLQDNGESSTFVNVPAPGSLALFGLAMIGLGALRRRS